MNLVESYSINQLAHLMVFYIYLIRLHLFFQTFLKWNHAPRKIDASNDWKILNPKLQLWLKSQIKTTAMLPLKNSTFYLLYFWTKWYVSEKVIWLFTIIRDKRVICKLESNLTIYTLVKYRSVSFNYQSWWVFELYYYLTSFFISMPFWLRWRKLTLVLCW